jgi:hypothetical protein
MNTACNKFGDEGSESSYATRVIDIAVKYAVFYPKGRDVSFEKCYWSLSGEKLLRYARYLRHETRLYVSYDGLGFKLVYIARVLIPFRRWIDIFVVDRM